MKLAKKALAVLLAAAMLTGCSSANEQSGTSGDDSSASNGPVSGGTYIVRQASDPASFNPDAKPTTWSATRQ